FGYLIFGAPTLFAFWLVGQEKIKGTLRLLKLLPISGMQIIAAKSLASLTLCLLLNLMSLLGAPLVLRLAGFAIAPPGLPIIFWMSMAVVIFVALNIAIFTTFDHKIATQIVYFGLFVVMIAVMVADKFLSRRGVSGMALLTSAWRRWYFPYW